MARRRGDGGLRGAGPRPGCGHAPPSDGLTIADPKRSGRRPGRQDTRGEILTSARETFAAKGYASASVRGIATAAGVDPALVHHYFGTKQELFRATIALPVDFTQVLPHLVSGGTDGLGERIVRTILTVWSSPARPALVAAARAALADPASGALLREFVMMELFDRLVDHLDLSDPERRVGLVATQALGLIVSRFLLELPVVVERTDEELIRSLGATLQRYLTQ